MPPAAVSDILISGHGFSPSKLLSCVFRVEADTNRSSAVFAKKDQTTTLLVEPAQLVSLETVACTTAPLATFMSSSSSVATTLTIQVGVSNNGVETEDVWASLILSDAPEPKRILPTAGPVAGGTIVDVFGQGFLDSSHLSCAFGSSITSGTFVSSSQVTCMTPPLRTLKSDALQRDTTKRISLTVSNNGEHYSEVELDFLYLPAARILAIYPRLISVEDVASGLAVATISGTGFSQHLEQEPRSIDPSSPNSASAVNITCRFAGLGDSVAIVLRSTMITCPLPVVTASEGVVVVTVSINGQDFPPPEYGGTLVLAMAPRVGSVFPSMGTSSGGTVVHVSGDHFSVVDPLVCIFQFGNATEVDVSAEYDGHGFVICTTPPVPPGQLNGTYSEEGNLVAALSVAVASRSSSANNSSLLDGKFVGVDFTYFAAPAVSDIFPRGGAPATLVDVVGEGFLDTPSLACRFGDITVSPEGFKRPNVVTCKAPIQTNESAVVAVEISNNMADWTNDSLNFAYRQRTVLTSVTPKVGPVNGSTIVRVAGSGFPGIGDRSDGNISCRFGSTAVEATPAADGEIFCVSPAAGGPGSVSLEIAENGVDVTNGGWRFEYVPDVEVSSVRPLSGPEMGGTAVTIAGPNFVGQESVVCQFGGPSSRVAGRWLDRASIVCTTPPQRPGSVQLAISTNGQQFVDTGLAYAYQPQATVRSLLPSTGSVQGGTIINVSGAGFINTTEAACLVGERFGEATYINPTLVQCRVPEAQTEDGTSLAAVRIANNGVDFTDNLDAIFEYVPSFEVIYVEPTAGPTTGGTTLRVTGTGFETASNISCVVNEVIVETVVETSERVACATPSAASPGRVKIALTNNRVDFSRTLVSFLYHSPIEVTSVYPTSAPENGGSRLLVTGSGFTDTAGLSCTFTFYAGRERSTIESAAVYISENLVSCGSPAERVGEASVHITNNGVDLSASWVPFTVTSTSTVTMVWPSSGSTNGGTDTRVRGTAFVDSLTAFCRFGDEIVRANTVVDHTTVLCTSPPREDEGQVTVDFTSNGVDWTASGVSFTYLPPIEILGVSPNIGPLGGGTVVLVSGSGIGEAANGGKLSCRFGRIVVSATLTGAGGALCVAPPSLALGPSSLELSSNGVDFSSDGWMFYYSPDITVASGWPLFGPESGETSVTIMGTGFTNTRALVCEFGSVGTIVRANWVDSTTISCLSPPHMPGTASLRLSVNGQQFLETGLVFKYLMESTVRAITPSFGSSQGGTLVQVTGAGFVNSTSLSCRLAGRRLPAVFHSSGSLHCTSPQSASSVSLPLEVSNNGIDFTSSGVLYTFVPPLGIRHFWPTNGPTAGGTSVVVRGSGFLDGGKVFCVVDGRQTLASTLSDDELSCLAPRRDSTGHVRLELTRNKVDKVLSTRKFTYVAPIVLTGMSPSRSGEEGGVTVVVSGENFIASPSLVCRFAGQDATPAAWLSSTRVSCLVPASPEGPRDVSLTISNNAQDFATEPLVFSYVPAFTVVSSDPTTGPVDGGTEITLAGTGLGEVGPWACVFGKTVAVPAIQLDNGLLRCRSPPYAPSRVSLHVYRSPSPLASAVSGAIAAAKDDALRNFGVTFEYEGAVFISSIEPRSGSTSGGTPVTLRGFGFTNASKLTCGFGEQDGRLQTSLAVRASADMVVCYSPPRSFQDEGSVSVGRSIVSVTLSLNEADFTRRGPQFMYYEPVDVLGVFPNTGSTNGGSAITVVGRHFLPSEALSCRFGVFAASEAEFLSSDVIRCFAPPSPDGPMTVEVTVSNNFVEFSDSSATFEYRQPVRPERFSPTAGPLNGGTLLTVEGSGFSATSSLACRIGGVAVKANLHSTSRITCQTPEFAAEQQVLVQVTVNGAEWEDAGSASNLRVFTYYQPPKVTKLHPSTGPLIGGTHLSIFGHNFAPVSVSGPVLCRIRNASTAASEHVSAAIAWDVSATNEVEEIVTCKIPDIGAGDFTRVEVAVSTDGGVHFSTPSLIFTYVQVRKISRMLGIFERSRG